MLKNCGSIKNILKKIVNKNEGHNAMLPSPKNNLLAIITTYCPKI